MFLHDYLHVSVWCTAQIFAKWRNHAKAAELNSRAIISQNPPKSPYAHMEIVVHFCSVSLFCLFSDGFEGPGLFKQLRETGRINFHHYWYLSDFVVPSYDHFGGKINDKKSNDYFNVSVKGATKGISKKGI